MVEIKNIGISEIEQKRRQSAYRELIKTEGWKYLTEEIEGLIKLKKDKLINTAVNENDIRIINQLGRDISLYEYVLSIPGLFVENIERFDNLKKIRSE